MQIGYKPFTGKSYSSIELFAHPDWESDYIAATPRMAEYIKVSSQIYGIYLKYIAPEDIHVYSIDEIFADVTEYLQTYKKTAHQLAMTMIRDVLKTTGITATAGIGTNLYLCKVAMDVVAKHIPADKDGVRIAEPRRDELSQATMEPSATYRLLALRKRYCQQVGNNRYRYDGQTRPSVRQ